jgi:hypothetical protein
VTALAARPPARPGPAPCPRPGPDAGGGWVVSPAFDLLFLANVAWPLLFLPGLACRSETAVDFWQVYFLTLPHRWITLLLVSLDPERRAGRGPALAAVAAAFFLLVVGVWAGTAAFTCLALADYVWNAWHFAAQHAGVLRIYTRKVGGGWDLLERHGLRSFVTYAVLRTAVWLTGWLEVSRAGEAWVRAADLAVLVVPVLLVGSALAGFTRARIGKTAYLLSLCGLYSGLLLSLSYRWAVGAIVLTTASSLFHAVEYLAVVTHYAWRRREVGREGAFRRLAGAWLPSLGLYAATLGAAGVWLDGKASPAFELWQGVNLWAALVHYAFDGMIWKLRRPETARALGAERVPVAA